MKYKAIIVDIDGTLADVRHRRHFLDETPPDWKSFSESCIVDTLNDWCDRLILGMSGQGYSIILVSGRMEEYRSATEDWLAKHHVVFDRLYMRQNGDFRADTIIKREIFDNHIKRQYDIIFVVDDRKSVVDMWREIGLVCLQCDIGDY